MHLQYSICSVILKSVLKYFFSEIIKFCCKLDLITIRTFFVIFRQLRKKLVYIFCHLESMVGSCQVDCSKVNCSKVDFRAVNCSRVDFSRVDCRRWDCNTIDCSTGNCNRVEYSVLCAASLINYNPLIMNFSFCCCSHCHCPRLHCCFCR